MRPLWLYVVRCRIRHDERGQDLIEYALLVAFGAVSLGAVFPPLAGSITEIFSKLASMIADAAN